MLSEADRADIAARYRTFYNSVELPVSADEVVERLHRELAVPVLHRYGPDAVDELMRIATAHRATLAGPDGGPAS